VSRNAWETRAALVEDGEVAEIEIEHASAHAERPGDVYLGRVRRHVPGLDAAFLDLGSDRPAYLPLPKDERAALGPIRKGQALLVQVAKAPLGGKGSRLTAKVVLPSRRWVLTSGPRTAKVSRKIDDPRERERLTRLGERALPEGAGLTARTAAQGVPDAPLAEEAAELVRVWTGIVETARTAAPPMLLRAETGLATRWLRDRLDASVERVIVDDAQLASEAGQWIAAMALGDRCAVEIETGDPFARWGGDQALRSALAPAVRLPSGGHVRIDKTQALIAIDVDTGRFVGSRDLETTVLRTNLEAVAAIARQVRLRNLGGILVIDFIDMTRAENRERVLDALRAGFARDAAPTAILPMNSFGLVHLTRKRTRPDLAEQLESPCPHCQGSGRVAAAVAVGMRVLRALSARASEEVRTVLVVRAPPHVVDWLRDDGRQRLGQLERSLGRTIVVRADGSLGDGSFAIEP